MYHKDKNIIFIHITKSAGGTVQQAFKRDGFYFDLAGEHTTAQQHLEILDKNVFDQCFKFSFVRNPWARMASIYFYYYQYHKSLEFCPTVSHSDLGTLPDWLAGANIRDLSFKNWLKAFCLDNKGVMGAAHKTCSNLNIKHFHFNQLNWLVSSNTTDNELLVDYIGKVENIQSDMDHICNQIGIKKMDLSVIKNANPVLQPKVYKNDLNRISKFVPHARLRRAAWVGDGPDNSINIQETDYSYVDSSVNLGYSSVYDEESIELVRNLCKKDIDFFQYEYDL